MTNKNSLRFKADLVFFRGETCYSDIDGTLLENTGNSFEVETKGCHLSPYREIDRMTYGDPETPWTDGEKLEDDLNKRIKSLLFSSIGIKDDLSSRLLYFRVPKGQYPGDERWSFVKKDPRKGRWIHGLEGPTYLVDANLSYNEGSLSGEVMCTRKSIPKSIELYLSKFFPNIVIPNKVTETLKIARNDLESLEIKDIRKLLY